MKIYKDNGKQEKYFEALNKAMLAAVGSMELWAEYKENFTEEEWPAARENIFNAIKKLDHRACTWYAEEDRYDLIMDIVEALEDIGYLKEYEKIIKKLYPERCLAVLVCKADQVAHDGNKRSDYRRLAGLLNWIQKYPEGDEKSKQLAQKYREAYPRRFAMLEEINRF